MKLIKPALILPILFTSSAGAMENPLGLSAFTGTWECVDRMGESQLSSLLTITQVGRDLWEVDYAQEQNPAWYKPYQSKGVWGYNPYENRLYRYVFDNFNGSDMGFSSGLHGDSLVWMGESQFFGEKFQYEGHFQFKSPSHYESRYLSRRVNAAPEDWAETVWSDCRKIRP